MIFKSSFIGNSIIAVGVSLLVSLYADKDLSFLFKSKSHHSESELSLSFLKEENWLCDCEKRVPITISGGDSLLSNYQVKLSIPDYAEINSSYTNIQFTDSTETNSINHWTQTYNTSNGVVWVKVPSIPTSGTTIYMYYGGCGSGGNAINVFDYFNDFTDTTGITDTRQGDFSIGTYAGLSVLKKENECDPNGAEILLGFNFDDYVLITKETRPDDGNSNSGCALNRYGVENSGYNGYGINRNGHTGANLAVERRRNAGGGNSRSTNLNPDIPRGTFVITELRRCTANNQNQGELFSTSGVSLAQVTSSINNHNYSNFDRIMIRGGHDFYVDYMALAKFSCNAPSYSFGLPIEDGPEALCQNISVSLDMSGSVTILPSQVDSNSMDNCDTNLSLSLSKTSFDCDDIGLNVIALTVTDNHNNTDQCSASITVLDNLAPSVTCPADQVIPTDPGSCEASSVSLGSPISSDNCGIANSSNNAPLSYGVGDTTIIWTVTDDNGNSSTCTQFVTVQDTIAPTILCPDTISVAAGENCIATGVDLVGLITGDNCGIQSSGNNAPDSFLLGYTTVLWSATDTYGNVSTCSQVVYVTDTLPPSIQCADDVNVSADETCVTESVTLTTLASMDNCSVSSLSSNAPDTFPIGLTIVTWTITDGNSNAASCEQNVTVIDSISPILSCVDTLTFFVSLGACSVGSLNLTIPSIFDNCNFSDTSNNAPASYPVGNTIVIWSAEDSYGNVGSCVSVISVLDTILPIITCPTNVSVNTEAGECTASGVNLGTPTYSDDCGILSLTVDSLTIYPVGINTVNWTVSDSSGNRASCMQSVTITDNEVPMISCQDTVLGITDFGSCTSSTVNLSSPLISDNCAIDTFYNDGSFPFAYGDTTVIWTVEDEAGNTSSCQSFIIITDTEFPIITCPNDTIFYTDPDSCNATISDFGMATAVDNCGINSIGNNAPSIFNLGVRTVTWNARDFQLNRTTCTQRITVLDTIAPTITCADTLSVNVDAGLCTRSGVTLTTPTISDYCTLIDTSNNALATYPLGITEVTWTVEDNSNNTSTCIQVVEVIDNEDPSITCPADTVVYVDAVSCSVSGLVLKPSTTQIIVQ